jgi:hypothetical protein
MDVHPVNRSFESGFTGFRGLLIIPTFRRCDDASAKGFEMKEAPNNNLPIRTNDVVVNPINLENPDSKTR